MGKWNSWKLDEKQVFLTLRHSNWTICSLLSWFFPKKCLPSWPLYWEVQFLITPERGAGYEKRDSLKSGWDTGVSVPGAFKLDHLQTVELILFQKISIFFIFILGVQLSIATETGRAGAGNEKKGFTQKWMRHRDFSTLGIQIGPFATCWAHFVPKNFHLFDFHTGSPIIYYPRDRKRGSSRGWKWEKGIHPKLNETQGFLYLRHSNWTICSLLSWFCSKEFPSFWLSYWKSNYLLPQRQEERK